MILEKDNIVQLKKEIEIEKQNIRISDKLVETLVNIYIK